MSHSTACATSRWRKALTSYFDLKKSGRGGP